MSFFGFTILALIEDIEHIEFQACLSNKINN